MTGRPRSLTEDSKTWVRDGKTQVTHSRQNDLVRDRKTYVTEVSKTWVRDRKT